MEGIVRGTREDVNAAMPLNDNLSKKLNGRDGQI
jgi:hypothetical protein